MKVEQGDEIKWKKREWRKGIRTGTGQVDREGLRRPEGEDEEEDMARM